jgi:hypothetical protein
VTQSLPSLESVWEDREERIYPALFGPLSRGIFPLDMIIFTEVFGQESVDPRWLHYGVLEYAPIEKRRSWLYATTGFSNPWEQDPTEYRKEEYSGFGTELVFEVPDQSEWAIITLRKLLAYNILLAHGRYGELSALDEGDRMPLGRAIDGSETSRLQFIAVSRPRDFAPTFQLASGQVNLLQIVGITESERDYARDSSTDELIALLTSKGAFPVTDPNRDSVV